MIAFSIRRRRICFCLRPAKGTIILKGIQTAILFDFFKLIFFIVGLFILISGNKMDTPSDSTLSGLVLALFIVQCIIACFSENVALMHNPKTMLTVFYAMYRQFSSIFLSTVVFTNFVCFTSVD